MKFCCREESVRTPEHTLGTRENDNVDDRCVNQTASAVYENIEEEYVDITTEKNTNDQYESLKK